MQIGGTLATVVQIGGNCDIGIGGGGETMDSTIAGWCAAHHLEALQVPPHLTACNEHHWCVQPALEELGDSVHDLSLLTQEDIAQMQLKPLTARRLTAALALDEALPSVVPAPPAPPEARNWTPEDKSKTQIQSTIQSTDNTPASQHGGVVSSGTYLEKASQEGNRTLQRVLQARAALAAATGSEADMRTLELNASIQNLHRFYDLD